MGIIDGSLSESLATYHSPKHAELAVVIIDEKPIWEVLETPESALIRRNNQAYLLQKAKELKCKIITIDLPNKQALLERNSHIKSVVNDVDYEFIKLSTGVLGDEKHESIELLKYLEMKKVTSLLVMGGNVNCCVTHSIVGEKNYPGLSTYGFNILTTSSILSPYVEDRYSFTPCFKPDARMHSFESIFKSDNQETHSKSLSLYGYRSYKTNEERKGEWPLFIFYPGVRFYLNI